MKTNPRWREPILPRLARAWRGLLIGAAACAAILPGCGGGGGVGTGGTGSFASGTISGFGSVIVNAVRFELSAGGTEVVDGDGAPRASADLKLGMTVDIDSGPITKDASGTSTANATRIRVDSELVGPVSAVDASGFTVLGQRVDVTVFTIFDESLVRGLSSIVPGVALQVFALFDPTTSTYRATRVEPTASPAHLRGPLTALDTNAKSLRIGAVSYSYSGLASLPAGLAVGQFVRVTLGATGSSFAVTGFGVAQRTPDEAEGVKLKGRISAFTSTSRFFVNGREVDASGVTAPAGLVAGALVEVEGTLRGGTLVASSVTVTTEGQERDHGFEIRGAITSVASDKSSFLLRGQTIGVTARSVKYSPNGKTAADLASGLTVEVKGLLSADGRRVDATEIKFD